MAADKTRFKLQALSWLVFAAHGDVTKQSPSYCELGIVDGAQQFCCPKMCGQCGGPGCASRPGSAQQCCSGMAYGTRSNQPLPAPPLCTQSKDVACRLPPMSGETCWPRNDALDPLPVPRKVFLDDLKGEHAAGFEGRVDVLQVTIVVCCLFSLSLV